METPQFFYDNNNISERYSPILDLSIEYSNQYDLNLNDQYDLNFNDQYLSKFDNSSKSTLSTDSIINFDHLDEEDINLDFLLNQDFDCIDNNIVMEDISDLSVYNDFSNGTASTKTYTKSKRKNKHTSILPYNIHDITQSVGTSVKGNLNNEDLVKGKPGDRLVLSNEEKQLLIRDGYHLPTHLPLTKTEERALKSIRRKIRNKISAKNSRAKKKTYVGGLEERIIQCSKENVLLKHKLSELEDDKMSLYKQVLNLRKQLSKFLSDSPTSSTSLMLLLLTFMLITCPMLDPRQLVGKNINSDQSNSIKQIFPGRTRMLLQESESSISLGEPYMITIRAAPPWQLPPKSPAVPLKPLKPSKNMSEDVEGPSVFIKQI